MSSEPLTSYTQIAVGDLLSLRAKAHPDRAFFQFGNQVYSYGSVDTRASRLAKSFNELGIERGDRVAIMLPNCPEFVFCWLALAKLGAITAGIDIEQRGDALRYLLDKCEASLLIASPSSAVEVDAIGESLPLIQRVISVADGKAEEQRRFTTLQTVPFRELGNSGRWQGPGPSLSDSLMLLYTSGSTGRPKAVDISHGYGLHMGFEYAFHLEYTERDILYTPYPMFHAEAPLCSFLAALLVGAQVVLSGRFSASRFWSEVRSSRATAFDFIGGILSILYKQPPRPDDAENPVRVVAGGPMPPMARDFERRFGVKLIELYGVTECCVPAWDPLNGQHRSGACGQLCAHHEVQIFDDNDQSLPPRAVGEIVVRTSTGFGHMTGYHRDDQATITAWRNLWYHSGDLGYLDEDGWLYFVDRKKEAIRRRGTMIAAYDIESVIGSHPAITDAIAIGVPSDLTDEEIKVVALLEPGATCTPLELVEYARERLPRYMVPRYVEVVSDLNRTPILKVRRHELRASWKTPETFDTESGQFVGRST
jgi:carnitine-CoA ligase